MKKPSVLSALSVALVAMTASGASAQITAGDYQRAQSLRQQYESAAVLVPDTPTWAGTTHRFYYRRSVANGFEFVIVDADTQRKERAFDHTRLAEALSRASGRTYSPTRLPFNNFTFNDALSAIDMTIDGARWTCTLADYAVPHAGRRRPRARSAAASRVPCAAILLPRRRGHACHRTASGWPSSTTTTSPFVRSAARSE